MTEHNLPTYLIKLFIIKKRNTSSFNSN